MAQQDVTIRKILVDPGIGTDPTSEVVQLHNDGDSDVDLTGWVLKDTRTHAEFPYTFRFPHVVLNPDDDISVHTGTGTDDPHHLFWGMANAVWNNSGDEALLIDASGGEVDRKAWDSKPPAGLIFDTGPIAREIAQHAQAVGFGSPAGPVRWNTFAGRELFWQEFQGRDSAIFHSGYASPEFPEKSIHEVPAPIYGKYDDLGGAKALGMPLTGKKRVPGSTAFFNDFRDGSIYFHEEFGVHFMGTAIRDKWRERGGATGPFGLPVDDERVEQGTDLRYVDFDDGSVWQTENGVRAMQGIRIDCVGFHCFGEDSSFDEGASDEVYFTVEASPLQRPSRPENHFNDSTWFTVLPTNRVAYENVDAGETITEQQAVFWTRPTPFTLNVVGFEHDFGDPNALRAEIQGVVASIGLVGAVAFPAASAVFLNPVIQQTVASAVNALLDTDDDVIQAGHWSVGTRRALLDLIDGPAQEEFGLQHHQRIMLDDEGDPQEQIYFRLSVTE
ncbi:lamin tail domain-containing protein [Streptomyces pathocidini]|uniref:Lamin tail domain-containing protein n=1 Tax=Streptomyces pathocidini TaxID=1650571 RepID=A0ABW7UUS7_9ACTN|nr:lamin tail domain-containing protein [Streptomyces pathocidini]